jgi:hypothetical protein
VAAVGEDLRTRPVCEMLGMVPAEANLIQI